MRKLLSILLLCLFGLPLVSPALGQVPDSRLPACCRRGGDHHCAGGMSQQAMDEDRQASPNPRFGVRATGCPYTPGSLAFHLDLTCCPPSTHGHSAVLTHTLVAIRNTTIRRIARDPSRPKRGPPASSFA